MKLFTVFLLLLTVISVPAHAAEDVKIQNVKNNIHVLISPKGGNVVVATGEQGTFIVDDQLAQRSKIIDDAIKTINDQGANFIVNTHYHFDHTGGNEFLGANGAVIVSHEKVRERLSTKQFIEYFKKEMEPLSKEGLPTITFTQDISFHYNDDEIHVIHTPAAHTDGDAFVHFTKENVIATGDLVFNGMYPFIDIDHGGSINGVIQAVDKMIELSNAQTKIVPGHGDVMNLADLKDYKNTLVTIVQNVQKAIDNGKGKEGVIAEKPSKLFDVKMHDGIVDPDAFVSIVYDNLSR